MPDDWIAAIEIASERRRILVVGATDVGKSSFIRAVAAARGAPLLIDLDPGQKMLGPPGAASLGTIGHGGAELKRFIFLGSTSASNLWGIARAARELAPGAGNARFIVNTAGFVTGLGARLQAMTAAAIRPDLVVEIGSDGGAPILAPSDLPLLRIGRSPSARRKSPAMRRAIRQDAFLEALSGAALLRLRFPSPSFHPGPPLLDPGLHPVCALTTADGEDLALGVVLGAEADAVLVYAPPPPKPIATIRLGKMWAEPDPQVSWRLLDKLSPSWIG